MLVWECHREMILNVHFYDFCVIFVLFEPSLLWHLTAVKKTHRGQVPRGAAHVFVVSLSSLQGEDKLLAWICSNYLPGNRLF